MDRGSIHDTLKRYWGYDSFRAKQEEIINSVLLGKDTLGLLPTGGGKSITFQVPAMLLDGLTIVVTPLIALMKDQADGLRDRHINAAYIHSGLRHGEIRNVIDRCMFGKCKFLYISPERLASSSFIESLRRMKVSLIVVDEAHCISQWGYDFRPSYLNIASIRQLFPGAPVLALTASATPAVVADIMQQLQFKEPNVIRKSFRRDNLSYIVRHQENKTEKLFSALSRIYGSGIIYVRSRAKTKDIAEQLKSQGFSADYYHAGLTTEEKRDKQDKWKRGEIRIIVATNAFGMGIDKPDVRIVVHHDLPSSLEEYYQEAGRAGRDGQPARCTLLYSGTDVRTIRFFIDKEREADNGLPADVKAEAARKAEERLKYMTFYSTTQRCLRGFLLQYFGEAAPKKCGNCSCCLAAEQEAQLQVEYARRRAAQSADRLEKPRRAKPAAGSLSEADEKLLNALYAVRKRLAGKQNLPAFMVFNDATLREMAEKKPMSIDELLNISGVGEKKAARYGNAFLRVIEDAVGSRE